VAYRQRAGLSTPEGAQLRADNESRHADAQLERGLRTPGRDGDRLAEKIVRVPLCHGYLRGGNVGASVLEGTWHWEGGRQVGR